MKATIKNAGYKRAVIIGAGFVGASIVYSLMLTCAADEIILVDVVREKAAAEVDDIRHGMNIGGSAAIRVGDFSDCAVADLIIIAAGKGRKAGQSRRELAIENAVVMKEIIESLKPDYNDCPVLVITNPVDTLTYLVSSWLGAGKGQVLSSGCSLDTSRFARLIADYLGVDIPSVEAYVIGEHGDAQVPLWSSARIEGVPIAEYCECNCIEFNEAVRADIATKTKKMGAEIIRGKGRTNFGIATCACVISEAILHDEPITVPVGMVLTGELGESDVSLSIPCIVRANGICRADIPEINDEERLAFSNAAKATRELLCEIKKDVLS